MAIQRARQAIGRTARRWHSFFIDTVEWTSNGGRRRPKFSERSDIYDPTAGYGPGGELNEDLEAERRGRPDD
jgi:hypothetical protein